jgi:MFS family permease
MTIRFLEPLGRAWTRMKQALFRPFDLHKWFVVGFNAFLAALMEGNNYGGGSRAGKDGDFGEFIHFPRQAWAWFQDNPGWTVAILFGIAVLIAIVVALTWVSSRGVFMFMDNVVHDKVEIARPWREYEKEGNSLFVWRLLFGLFTFVVFGALFAFFFIRGAAIYDSGAEFSSYLPLVLGLGLAALAIILVWGYIVLFLKDFVAALMYKHRVPCGQAWRMFMDVFKRAPLHFIGYGLLVFLLMILFVVAVIFAGFGTCCIGFIVLIIPYINVVVTLPAWYTYRGFSLEFLAQFGPDCDVFPKKEAEAPAAPAAASPAV